MFKKIWQPGIFHSGFKIRGFDGQSALVYSVLWRWLYSKMNTSPTSVTVVRSKRLDAKFGVTANPYTRLFFNDRTFGKGPASAATFRNLENKKNFLKIAFFSFLFFCHKISGSYYFPKVEKLGAQNFLRKNSPGPSFFLIPAKLQPRIFLALPLREEMEQNRTKTKTRVLKKCIR